MPPLTTNRLTAFLLVALFLAVGRGATAHAEQTGHLLQGQASAASCAGLATNGAQLSQDLTGLNPAGSLGNPELCLLYYPSENVYHAVILSLDSADQFRSAKADAIARLTSAGFDPCQIVGWTGQGAQPIQLSVDDQLDLPVTCVPRVEAGDAGAQNWTSAVSDAINQMVSATADQMGWQPNRSAVVKVYTDTNTAIAAYQQYLASIPGNTADSLAQDVRTGVYYNNLIPRGVLPSLMLVNLTRAQDQNLAAIKQQVAFDYTGFAATTLGGNNSTSTAQWFREGLDFYQADRNAGAAQGYLGIAAGAQTNGTAPHLQNLEQLSDWNTAVASAGRNAVQARAYAAMVYLVENYGFDRVVQLLRQSNGGTLAQFDANLQALAGTDSAGLDQALGAWLTGVTPVQAGGSGFSVSFTTTPGSSYSEATVTFTQALSCGSSTVPSGTKVTFPLTVQAAQSFSGSGGYRNGILALQGTLQGSSASGTFRYTDATANCDTGPLSFQ